MNFYKLHAEPTKLHAHDKAHDTIAHIAWDSFKNDPDELGKRESTLAKDPTVAFDYARMVLDDRFFEGENAISKNPAIAYRYALQIVNGPFPKGEAAIAKDPHFAVNYAINILHSQFPECEPFLSIEQVAQHLTRFWTQEYMKAFPERSKYIKGVDVA